MILRWQPQRGFDLVQGSVNIDFVLCLRSVESATEGAKTRSPRDSLASFAAEAPEAVGDCAFKAGVVPVVEMVDGLGVAKEGLERCYGRGWVHGRERSKDGSDRRQKGRYDLPGLGFEGCDATSDQIDDGETPGLIATKVENGR